VIGAAGMDNPESNEGSAFVFLGRPTWPATAIDVADVTIDNPYDAADSQFGFYINSAGDLNDDGYVDVVVSCQMDDRPEVDEGTAFIYFGRATWPAVIGGADVTIDNPLDLLDSQFGRQPSVPGDVNGDGIDDLVIGAVNFNNPESNEGAAFIYFGRATWLSTTGTADVQFDNPTDQVNGFLSTVGGRGDMNGDGFADIFVGATGVDLPESNEGAAFLWLGRMTWVATYGTADVTFDSAADQASSSFGGSIY